MNSPKPVTPLILSKVDLKKQLNTNDFKSEFKSRQLKSRERSVHVRFVHTGMSERCARSTLHTSDLRSRT